MSGTSVSVRGNESPQLDDRDKANAQHVLAALRGLRYGSVNIVVHDGQIVQIDRTEKQRFSNTSRTRAEP